MNNTPNKNPDPKALIAIAVCILFYLGWNQYIGKKYPDWNKPPVKTESTENTTPSTGETKTTSTARKSDSNQSTTDDTDSAPPSAEDQITQLNPEDLKIVTDTSVYEFSQYAGSLKSITLNKYLNEKSKKGRPINLTTNPFFIQGTTTNTQIKPSINNFNGKVEGNTVSFWRQSGAWKITQTFVVPEKGYAMDVAIQFTNTTDKTQMLDAGVLIRQTMPFPEVSGSFLPGASQARPSYIYSSLDSVEREDIQSECNSDDTGTIAQLARTNFDYFGIDDHYFLKVLLPETNELNMAMYKANATEHQCDVAIIAHQNQGEVARGDTISLNFKGYFGPKDLDVLGNTSEKLQNAIDYGFFGFIAKPLLLVVQGFHNLTGNYGVAIIITTLLLKLLFYPLMKASSTSMYRMKTLNPQMQEIREKFKDDRPGQQQAMMKFMSENKMNPMKGCFPILPQIPVFFAFWQVLRNSIDLRHAEFFGWTWI